MNMDTDDLDEHDEEILEIPAVPGTVKKVNYLNNKDMLKEIHKSKTSFCEFLDKKYSDYDVIVKSVEEIFDLEVQERAKVSKAARIAAAAYEAAMSTGAVFTKTDKPKLSTFKIDPASIPVDDLVFRVITYEHIPLAPGRKKKPKSVADLHVRLNFHPFKHYIIENNKAKEVGSSHTKNGKFSLTHGAITNTLAKMFLLMVGKYSQRTNWRNYTYLDEMKGQALLQLTQMGLQFDEYKSDNPFSYYTASVMNTFTRVFNLEKATQVLRDDLLINSGASPSFSRQLAMEEEVRLQREDALNIIRDNNA